MNRSELVKLLELVSPALADNNAVPMFENFCFTGKTVFAYNDQLGIIAPCNTGDAFALNGKVLLGLLKNSHSDDVEFMLDDTHDITIKAGKSRFHLPYHTEADFLFELPKAKKAVWGTALNSGLLAGIEACLMTASRDLTQEALLGITLKHDGLENMAFYSCDGDAVTRFRIDEANNEDDLQALLPNQFCETVLRTEKEVKTDGGQGSLDILSDEWVYATLNKISIYGRLLKPDNPLDHEELIEKTIKGKPTFLQVPKALDHALSRARVVADPESAKTELDVVDGKLKLSTKTHMGDIHDTMTWRGHPEVSIGVSAAALQRAISLCDEMAVLDRCTVHRKGNNLLVVASSMG